MLNTYQAQTQQNPHQELEKALALYPEQVFLKPIANVNAVIQTHASFQGKRDKHLSASDIWQGEKSKAERPSSFTQSIVAASIVPGTRKQTPYGETFDRVSIQPSWMTGKLVIVKEETHVDNLQRKVVFLGRAVEVTQAKKYLIDALLEEHFVHHSNKTIDLFKQMNKSEASTFLVDNFESLFASEKPALFHVEHGIIGEEHEPHETWRLVRLAPCPKDSAERAVVDAIREKIASFISVALYSQTIKERDVLAEKKTNSSKVV